MNIIHFSGKEILEIALKIELNGEIFYGEASKKATDSNLKALFAYLQNQEKKHYEDFNNLSHLIKEDNIRGLSRLIDAEEISLYLHALANSNVFTDPEAGATLGIAIKDDSEAIEIAIGLERDSILYYNEMLKIVKEEDKGLVENIISQEKEHERLLSEMRK